MNESVYQVITDRVVSLLEQGTCPWLQPWNSGEPPQNLISRKPYHGINSFLLNAMHYSSPFWLTFKQCQQMGGYVRKGEKSCPVVFWKWVEVQDLESAEKKKIPLLRYYAVFNAAQCDGIKIPTIERPTREHSPIEEAERIVAGMPNRPEIKFGFNQCFYSPAEDFIGMVEANRFRTDNDYYSTLFHEVVHSTGHQSRLNRKGVGGSGGSWSAFGSAPYAKEELVAEMGTAFLCAEVGIVERTIENSASYIASWLKRLKDDPKLVVQAAAQAQKAADYILNRKPAETADHSTETEPEAIAA